MPGRGAKDHRGRRTACRLSQPDLATVERVTTSVRASRSRTHADAGPTVRPTLAAQLRDAAVWSAVVVVGLLGVALAVRADVRFGTPGVPFLGEYRLQLRVGTVLAPAVATTVLLAVRAGVHRSWRWRPLLVASWVAAFAWTAGLALVEGGNGFARPVAVSASALLADVDAFAADPGGFLERADEADAGLSDEGRARPPGQVVLLWVLTRFGLERASSLGVALTALGCLAVPLVAVAVRSLCGEAAGRALLPALVLGPWAVWVAVSVDAVVGALTAGVVALACLAAEQRDVRYASGSLAVASGLLLGVAAQTSYSAPWLGLAAVLVFFVRRRPALLVLTGLAALVPLFVLQALGFVWPDGLAVASEDFATRVEPTRSYAAWAPVAVLVLLIAAGPVLVASARAARRTPGWPFLVAALAATGFALFAGFARGEVERTWLPYFPWLLVAAVAPPRRGAAAATEVSPLLVGLGAASAVVLQAVLRTAW